MRWFRAWEGDLYRRAMRKTARSQWDLTRFSVDGGPEASRAGYRETQAAVSQAAKQAMVMAESNCGRPGPRERLALLYFDFWGQCSHLEQAFNWRDSFDLDVIPKFLLRDHGVNGYSCKIQAGRAAFVQGLNMAAELFDGGDIDSVLLGGVFRFYPALGFSEALVNAEQEQRWLGKGGQHTAAVIERAGFVVLKRGDATTRKTHAPVMLDAARYLNLTGSRAAATQQLCLAWSNLLPEARGLIYGGLYPSSALAAVVFDDRNGTPIRPARWPRRKKPLLRPLDSRWPTKILVAASATAAASILCLRFSSMRSANAWLSTDMLRLHYCR